MAVTSSASHQAVEAGERRRGGGAGGAAIEDGGMSRIGRCCRCRREKFDACDDGLAAATVTARCDIDSAIHLRACDRGQLVDPRGRAAMRLSDVVVVVRGIEVSTRICCCFATARPGCARLQCGFPLDGAKGGQAIVENVKEAREKCRRPVSRLAAICRFGRRDSSRKKEK